MEPEIITAIIAAGTGVIAILGFVWQIGRWQAKAEARSHELCRRLNEFVERAEEDHKQSVKDIAGVHERVDEHLRDHSLAPPP